MYICMYVFIYIIFLLKKYLLRRLLFAEKKVKPYFAKTVGFNSSDVVSIKSTLFSCSKDAK